MFGVYDTGPWLGIKMRGNDFIGWIGAGLQTYNLMVPTNRNIWKTSQQSLSRYHCNQVWRHTCIFLSRRTGKFKVVENGIKHVEKESEEIKEWMKNVSSNGENITT